MSFATNSMQLDPALAYRPAHFELLPRDELVADERLAKRVALTLELAGPLLVSTYIHISHDRHCRRLRGKPRCNCPPEIEVTSCPPIQ